MGRVIRVFSNMSTSQLSSMLMLDEGGMEGMLTFTQEKLQDFKAKVTRYVPGTPNWRPRIFLLREKVEDGLSDIWWYILDGRHHGFWCNLKSKDFEMKKGIELLVTVGNSNRATPDHIPIGSMELVYWTYIYNKNQPFI